MEKIHLIVSPLKVRNKQNWLLKQGNSPSVALASLLEICMEVLRLLYVVTVSYTKTGLLVTSTLAFHIA